ncbi:unnamed protein product [Cylicostephanus goldi]|uniref:SCP domain-containing protein n=1 Tax=Cylicostephanus goldi TaxID=71465 RepID=A0A3P7MYW6_CYLGO|nr:unnamed protein product [Cylicostephanus goldi]
MFKFLAAFYVNNVAPVDFNCDNPLITNEWRQMVLDFHNENRRKVAKGEQETKDFFNWNYGNMPSAADMNELEWDCDMERAANLFICNKIDLPDTYGVIFLNKFVIDACDLNCTQMRTKQVLQNWWNQAKKVDLSVDVLYDVKTIKEFGMVSNH